MYYDQFTSQWRSFFELATAFSTNLLLQADVVAWRTALGLGTAATATVTTNLTDTTVGRLLKVRDFGLSNSIEGVNIRTHPVNSFLSGGAGNQLTSSPDNGFGSAIKFGHPNQASEYYAAIYRTHDSERWFVTGSYGQGVQPWCELYHNRNILGTVSQSGGIPTGAIIQRGSNVNGSFVMFADGTAMYWGSRNVTGVSINPATALNLVTSFDCLDPNVLSLTGKTYAVTGASAFDSVGLPVYTIRGQNSGGATYLSLGTRPSDQWPYLNSFGPHVITSYFYEFFCIGRWF